jgi:hypothetical protein
MTTKTYAISSQPYYDTRNECYKNIIIINKPPIGELTKIVKKITTPKISPFKQSTPCCPIKMCEYALYKIDTPCELMTIDDISDLFGFLTENGYKIDTSITKMMNTSQVKSTINKLVCYISINK